MFSGNKELPTSHPLKVSCLDGLEVKGVHWIYNKDRMRWGTENEAGPSQLQLHWERT
jgi:hypothetical protein